MFTDHADRTAFERLARTRARNSSGEVRTEVRKECWNGRMRAGGVPAPEAPNDGQICVITRSESTNEELETSKEERQSTNEELTTTLDELRHARGDT